MDDNILATTDFHLTAITEKDLPVIASWYQDAGFLRLFDASPAYPLSVPVLAERLKETDKSSRTFLFGLRPVDADTLLGYVELEGILWAHRVGWLNIAIGDRTNWGRGYGRIMMQLALNFAFNELNLHRIQLTVFDYNPRAITLYEKMGFQREGTYREFMERDGQRHDMYLYGILRREWQALSNG